MVRARRLRRDYSTIPVTAEEEESGDIESQEVFEDEAVDGDIEAPPRRRRRSRVGRRQRRQYQTVSTTASEEDGEEEDDEEMEDALEEHQLENEEEEGTKVTLVVLDSAQKKFPIEAFTHWTVKQLKAEGQKVHKVVPQSQRLIYRGQLLQDDKTLEDYGINEDKLFIHLFPKPRVIIQNQSSSCGGGAGEQEETSSDSAAPGGAHIPQIVLNSDEAERRSTILVLGSTDFLEAQNNVKLFSFLLLVISSIELFNLLLILMGVPPEDQQGTNGSSPNDSGDDFFHVNVTTNDDYLNPYGGHSPQNQYNSQYDDEIQKELQTWHFSSNFDLALSVLGIYVAMLGIRATNETTLRLARQYLIGTFVVGIFWMLYNYWFTVHVDEEIDHIRWEERHNMTNGTHHHANSTIGNHTHHPSRFDDDDDDSPKSEMEYYRQNLSLMMIPGMVWILCCARAYQFQSLLEEAEREAEERIRNELEQHRMQVANSSGDVNNNSNNSDEGGDEETAGASPAPSGGGERQDSEVQNPLPAIS